MQSSRVALVTGASRGIGRGIAVKLARDGFDVTVNYRTGKEGAEKTLELVEQTGSRGIICKADVGEHQAVEKMIEQIISDLGRLDALICNAGIYTRAELSDLTPEIWQETMDKNLTGAYNCTYAAREHLEKSGENGRIVFITSQLAFRGTPQGAHYAASKAALEGFMKSTALSFAPHQVTVNAVSPGFVDTDLISGDTKEKRKEREELVPLGRIGTPDDIGSAVAFICSPEARYITGETIHVNGGLLMY
jgi:3-oxoacyl-[acyl-carrier protein] reductase